MRVRRVAAQPSEAILQHDSALSAVMCLAPLLPAGRQHLQEERRAGCALRQVRAGSALEGAGVADDRGGLGGALVEGERREAAQLAQQVLAQAWARPAVHVHHDRAVLRVQRVCQASHKCPVCTQEEARSRAASAQHHVCFSERDVPREPRTQMMYKNLLNRLIQNQIGQRAPDQPG